MFSDHVGLFKMSALSSTPNCLHETTMQTALEERNRAGAVNVTTTIRISAPFLLHLVQNGEHAGRAI